MRPLMREISLLFTLGFLSAVLLAAAYAGWAFVFIVGIIGLMFVAYHLLEIYWGNDDKEDL